MYLSADPSPENFEAIAERVSQGEPLHRIADTTPYLPSALVLKRWRREYPAFDAMLRDAESVHADRLAHETIDIADDENRSAAHARNGIASREKLAQALDRAAYGSGPAVAVNVDTGPGEAGKGIEDASTEQLWAMLASRGAIIDAGEEGGTPPLGIGARDSVREADPPPPERNSGETLPELEHTNSGSVISDGAGPPESDRVVAEKSPQKLPQNSEAETNWDWIDDE